MSRIALDWPTRSHADLPWVGPAAAAAGAPSPAPTRRAANADGRAGAAISCVSGSAMTKRAALGEGGKSPGRRWCRAGDLGRRGDSSRGVRGR
eukprot:scaffold39816_cov42-Phaeocystis_antarctica.AAC.2